MYNSTKNNDHFFQEECYEPVEVNANNFPEFSNISNAFTKKFVLHEKQPPKTEFIYIDSKLLCRNIENLDSEEKNFFHEWNNLWEAGSIRFELFEKDFPKQLEWIQKFKGNNLYLLPKFDNNNYLAYAPLYHLLPKHILIANRLPLIKKGHWPPGIPWAIYNSELLNHFDEKLSKAFAFAIWPNLISGSRIDAFSKNDSLKLLAHNLDFWLPYTYKFIEKVLLRRGGIPFESEEQKCELKKYRSKIPNKKRADLHRPLYGCLLWYGENEAQSFMKNLVEFVDKEGKLREIIDTIKSNRVQDDFSNTWSFAKEDFERALYKKRSNYKVRFIEIESIFNLQGPTNEIEGNIIWDDFFSILDIKEKQIVILLKKGYSNLTEISKILGYSNHSPVSKKLKNIKNKALNYINN